MSGGVGAGRAETGNLRSWLRVLAGNLDSRISDFQGSRRPRNLGARPVGAVEPVTASAVQGGWRGRWHRRSNDLRLSFIVARQSRSTHTARRRRDLWPSLIFRR